ncbi:hypothetical protein RJ639_003455 [Escallonia herrerae]|uniref:Uncharacterized protein n=1 Tax=Escallonia herrerae TaxID=1293975 RepID=A0AA89AY51_9ASTE|nr:hypothetical protein RJ639_003455 [Escallonia herrerae]
MSANGEQSELQNGIVNPEPDTDRDPNLQEAEDTAVQSTAPPPTPEPADADDSKLHEPAVDESIQSNNATYADPKLDEADDRTIQSTGDKPELRKDEGSRTFTMRELLNELKNGDSHDDDASTPYRYANAIEANPEDYDALYNWALVLQESADNVSPDSSSPSKDALLEEACKKYDEATRLCPTLHDAYYNWAIAISDRAKMRGRTKEAEELWKQALNNWGLALQELSAIVPAREKQTIVKTAISKFRAAIQLQFDFHRAIYNLGTVLYGLAEDTSRTGGTVNGNEVSPDELYSQSAIYIAAAHALKPNYSVYTSALKLVRSMLPLPYLKVGYLTAPPAGNSIVPHSEWRRSQFVLNHEGLQQIHNVEQRRMSRNLSNSGDAVKINRSMIKVNIPDIVSLSACADLTLPPGAGLCVDTIHGPVFLVADSWDSLDGWLDAIRLVYTIFARGKSEVLAGIITG